MTYTLMLYNVILFLSTFLVYLSEKSISRRQRNLCLFLVFLVLAVPSAIRYNVGTDLPRYEVAFYQIALGLDTRFELGYLFANHIVSFLGLSFEWFVALISLVTYAIYCKYYPDIKNAWIISFLYVSTLYLYGFSNIRSGLIYVIMFLSIFRYITKKELGYYLLAVIVSASLHKTALIYLIVPILLSNGITKLLNRKYFSEAVLVILTILLFNPSVLHGLMFNNPFVSMLGFDKYINHSVWGEAPKLGSGLGVVVKLIPIITFVLFRSYFYKREPRAKYVVVLSLLLFFCVDLALAVKVAHRFEKYFFVTYIMVIYMFYIYNPIKKMRAIFVLAYLAYYFLAFNLAIFRSGVNEEGEPINSGYVLRIAPYVTVFNKDDSSINSIWFE